MEQGRPRDADSMHRACPSRVWSCDGLSHVPAGPCCASLQWVSGCGEMSSDEWGGYDIRLRAQVAARGGSG